MTDDEKRKENQRLADRHQEVLQQLADLGREIEAAGNRMTPDFESRLAHLIKVEKQARAEYDAVRDGWHETINVKPYGDGKREV
jgi:hypothetical protein